MKRLKRIILSGFVLLAAWYPAPADAQGDVRTTYAVVREGRVTFQAAGVAEPFRVLFLSDTHFTVEDSRGEPYRKYSERMGGAAVRPENYGVSNGRERQLLKALAQARKDSVELVVLGGDMLNFPSLASVDSLLAIMTHSGLDWSTLPAITTGTTRAKPEPPPSSAAGGSPRPWLPCTKGATLGARRSPPWGEPRLYRQLHARSHARTARLPAP